MKEYTRRIMHRSVNPLTFLAIGLIISALPFLGFPASWETFFQVTVGITLAFLCAAEWWKHREKHAQAADTFVESRGAAEPVVAEPAAPQIAHVPTPPKTPEPVRKDDSIRNMPSARQTPSSRSSGVVSPYVAAPDSSISHVVIPQSSGAPKIQKVRDRRSNVKNVATSLPPSTESPVVAKPRVSPKRRVSSSKPTQSTGPSDRP